MTKYRYRKNSKRAPKEDKRKVSVRCLGTGPEHNFLSEDPARNRICVRCKAALAAVWADHPREHRIAASNSGGPGD